MLKKAKIVMSLLLCLVLIVIPISGVKESFSVQNVENSAMAKSVGLDSENSATLTYVQSVIESTSALHSQGVVSASGRDFPDAEKKAQILADKYLSFSYVRHFLVGMPSAENGIQKALNFLLASPILQLSSYVYICEGRADKLLEKISQDSISTDEVLTNLNLAGKQEGYYFPLTVLDISREQAAGKCSAVPIIGEKEDGVNSAKKSVIVFKGYALIEGGKLKAVLNRTQSRAFNLLTRKLERSVVECSAADFELKNPSCKFEFEMGGSAVKKVKANIKIRSDFARFDAHSVLDDTIVKKLEKELKAVLLAEINSLIEVLNKYHIDALDLKSKLDIKTMGRINDLNASLFGADFEVEIKMQLDKSYTMKGGIK